MGSTVCQAVADDPALELVAAVDPFHAGLELSRVAGVAGVDLAVSSDADSFIGAEVQVAVDFTEASAARGNLMWLADHGIHAVVGTTGFDDADVARFESAFEKSNCVIAPNFAIGAVLMMRLAALAAPYFETAEIIELHHDGKVDAPSGTATLTAERMAERMAEAKRTWGADPTKTVVYEGARGGAGPAGIRVHSVRMRGMVAHQEVLFGASGQTLLIRQDSYDRTSYMPGVLMAIRAIGDKPGLTFGLDTLLGI